MIVRLSELKKLFECESGCSYGGHCSRLVNEFIGEPLFLALLVECLRESTQGKWDFQVGDALGLLQNGKRSTTKWLDGYVFGVDAGGRIPSPIACEVKGWNDNSKNAFKPSKIGPKRAEFYWRGFAKGFERDTEKGGISGFCKLDADWAPPRGHEASKSAAVGLIMYHLLVPPPDADVEFPLGDRVRSLFWLKTPKFEREDKRVLVFSVAQYIRDRTSDEIEFNDASVDSKVEALQSLGIMPRP